MKNHHFKLLPLALAVSLAGCASNRALNEAQPNPGYIEIEQGREVQKLSGLIPMEKLRTASKQLIHEGIKALDEKQYRKASDLFNLGLKTDINNSYLHFLNALAYHYRGLDGESNLYALAEQGYEMAVRFDANNWIARQYLGHLYLDRRDYEGAKQMFMAALLYNPDDPELLYDLAVSAYNNKDIKVAAAALEGLKTLPSGDTPNPRHLRAQTLISAALGEFDTARKYLKELEQSTTHPSELTLVARRVNAWQSVHSTSKIKTQFSSGLPSPTPLQQGGARLGNAVPSGTALGGSPQGFTGQQAFGNRGANDFVEKQMVMVDVAIISSEEDNGSTMGVNLLEGLKIQFGSGSGTPAWSRTRGITDGTNTSVDALGAVATSGTGATTGAVTRQISIPGITYSLNIANARERSNEVLARPTLLALGGQTSQFFSGTDVVGAAVSAGQGSSVQIQKEVGVKLSVSPEFLPDGLIKLQVAAERTFLTNPNSNVVFDFRLDTTKTIVNANVAMRFGETIILSGLSERDKGVDNSGVPGLRDVPVVQYLFSRKAERDYYKSVLILLTPRRPQYTQRAQTHIEEDRAKFTEYDRVQAEFEDKHKLWFAPLPQSASIINSLNDSAIFREFRTGDISSSDWITRRGHTGRLRTVLDFLFF